MSQLELYLNYMQVDDATTVVGRLPLFLSNKIKWIQRKCGNFPLTVKNNDMIESNIVFYLLNRILNSREKYLVYHVF